MMTFLENESAKKPRGMARGWQEVQGAVEPQKQVGLSQGHCREQIKAPVSYVLQEERGFVSVLTCVA